MDRCNRCEYKSTNKSNQWIHAIIYGGMKYECKLCDYRTTTQSHLTYHIQCYMKELVMNVINVTI